MGAEGTLRHGTDTLVINAVHNRAYRTIRFQREQGGLSVMVAGHHQVFPFLVYGQVAAAHSADISGI